MYYRTKRAKPDKFPRQGPENRLNDGRGSLPTVSTRPRQSRKPPVSQRTARVLTNYRRRDLNLPPITFADTYRLFPVSWDYLFTGNQPRLGKVEVFRRTETLSLTSSAGPIRAHRIPSLRKSPEVKCSRARNNSEIARPQRKDQRERHACKLLRLVTRT